jgi:hypothetical protein
MISRFFIYFALAQLTIIAHDFFGFHSGVYILTAIFYAAMIRVAFVIRQIERRESTNA